MQSALAEYDSDLEEVETELPESNVEIYEKWPSVGYKPDISHQ